MKPILAILILTIAVSHVGAQDVRSKVAPPSANSFTNIIDPGKSIYGLPWGSTEDECISKFGYSTGYIRFNASDTVMIYGKEHAFTFKDFKLSGVRINNPIFDGRLAPARMTRTPFDDIRWQLSNGVRPGMNLADVKKILGETLLKDDPYHFYFNVGKARVDLDFAHYPREGDNEQAYKVHGVYIGPVASENVQKAPVSARPLYAQVPEATRPCSAEVAKWWEEVRAAAREILDAKRRKNQAVRDAGQRRLRVIDDYDTVLAQKELDKLDADIATAREKYGRLLTEGQAKSRRAPIEDSRPVTFYTAYPTYTEEARKKKIQGVVNLQVEFRSDGAIGDVKVISGLGEGLDEQAIKAIRQIIFLPSVKAGMFVTTSGSAQAEFHLQ